MSARPDTWMPMYWGDYARDTGHLSAAGHGAYLMLIKHYWCSGVPLADDDDELWRVACCDSKKDWQKLKPKIVRLFVKDGGLLRHKRIDKELSVAFARTEAKAEAGRKGAEKRWQKDGTPMAEPSPCHRQTDAQPQPQSQPQEASLASASPTPRANGSRLHPANGAGPPKWPDYRIVEAEGHPCVNGTYIDIFSEQLADAVGLAVVPLADKTMIEWLADGYESDEILPVIRRIMERSGHIPKSLAYFDKAVREAGPTWHSLPKVRAA